MSEWIKRCTQRPTRFGVTEYYFPNALKSIESPTAYIAVCDGSNEPATLYGIEWTHWRRHEPPPPRTVTIEISEEDAQKFVGIYGCSCCTNASAGVVAAACRKALEAKR